MSETDKEAEDSIRQDLIAGLFGDKRNAALFIRVCGPRCGCASPGKNPACHEGAGWNRRARERYERNDVQELKEHSAEIIRHALGGGNVGRVPHTNEIFFDADSPEAVEWMVRHLPESPRSARTEGRGHFFAATRVPLSQAKPHPKIDVRTNFGGLLVMPPSRHKSGDRYGWVNCGPLPQISDVLAAKVSGKSAPGSTGTHRRLAASSSGQQPDWFTPPDAMPPPIKEATRAAWEAASERHRSEGDASTRDFRVCRDLISQGVDRNEVVRALFVSRLADKEKDHGARKGKWDWFWLTVNNAHASAVVAKPELAFPKHCDSYAVAIEEMNRHAAILPTGKVAFRRAGETEFMKPQQPKAFQTLAPLIYYPKEKVEQSIDGAWLRDPRARRIDVVVCTRVVPHGFVESLGIRYLNTFVPPPLYEKPCEADFVEYVKPWIDLLTMQMNERDAHTLISIVAMHYQGVRPFYAIVLAGRGGDGKGLLGELFTRVYEWRLGYSNMLNTKSVKEPRFFENGCDGRMFVRIEEVDDRKVFEILKTQMDARSAKEPKGKDSTTSYNDALLLLTTNKPMCIPLEQESGVRRWALFNFEHSLSEDPAHIEMIRRLDALARSDRCVEVFRAYLQHYPWRKRVTRERAPETSCRELLRDEGKSDLDRRLDEVIAAEPSKAGTQGRVPYVFTAAELRLALNIRAGDLNEYSEKFVSQLLNERRGREVLRVRGGKQVELSKTEKLRLWVRGPHKEQLARAGVQELRKNR